MVSSDGNENFFQRARLDMAAHCKLQEIDRLRNARRGIYYSRGLNGSSVLLFSDEEVRGRDELRQVHGKTSR